MIIDMDTTGLPGHARRRAAPRGRRRPARRVCGPSRRLLIGIGAVCLLLHGCRPAAVTFPAEAIATAPDRAGYDTDGDKLADFFCLYNPAGRIDRIGYDRDGDGKCDQIVRLDAIDPRQCRHLVLVLDGIPFDVVKEFHRSGHLRLFDPPAVVIPPYPVLTDLALEDAFGYLPASGYEAKFYHRGKQKMVGGTGDYLAGKNEPFVKIIDYRASPLDDALAYLTPRPMFRRELADAKRRWDRRESMEMVAYFVASAGLGSRSGKEGQLHALRECERLMLQVLFETGGLVKFTLFADHGQTNVPCRPAGLAKHLKQKGWKLVERVRRSRDVAMVEFGLVTYAALNTRTPADLAGDLLECEAVELVSYAAGEAVVVRTRDGHAEVHSTDGRTFRYTAVRGDPLKLAGLVQGPADGRSLLKATGDGSHEYPDAMYRLWRAHFALAENPPDVIASLNDGYYNGSGFFAGAVKMASTHGGLNWRNSATFIMSTAGGIAGPLRSEDIPRAVGGLFGRPFPYGR